MPETAERLPKAIVRLAKARETLAQLGEPYFGGSVIGGSRSSGADSSRHPDPKGAPWRRKESYADQLINDLAHRLEKLVSPTEGVTSWKCPCGYPRWQGPGDRFCRKCGAPRPETGFDTSEPARENAHKKVGDFRA